MLQCQQGHMYKNRYWLRHVISKLLCVSSRFNFNPFGINSWLCNLLHTVATIIGSELCLLFSMFSATLDLISQLELQKWFCFTPRGRRLLSQWATIWDTSVSVKPLAFFQETLRTIPPKHVFNESLGHLKPCSWWHVFGCFKPNGDLYPKLWKKRANVRLAERCFTNAGIKKQADHNNVFEIKSGFLQAL